MNENQAEILSGAEVANAIKQEVAIEVKELVEKYGIQPGLAGVRVGEDPASAVYVGSKVKTSAELGIKSEHHHFSAEMTQDELLTVVTKLNKR